MNVIALTSLYRPHVGGVETMVEEMHTFLRQENHDLNVISKRWPENLSNEEIIDGVNIKRIKSPTNEEEMISLAYEIRDKISLLENGDILHMIGMRRPLPLFGVMLSHIHDKPVVGSIVGSEVPNKNSIESYKLWAEGAEYMPDAFRNTQSLSAVSESTKKFAIDSMPFLKNKIQVLPVGIDFDRYQNIEPKGIPGINEYILTCRRLEPSKGIDIAIRAFHKTKIENDIKLPLVIAGEGSDKKRLVELCKKLDLDDNSVIFLGKVSLDESIGMLKTASMTIVPSIAEGGGLINTEANALGCPLITSSAGGIEEYTNRDSAIFTEPGNVDQVSSAILTVIKNDQKIDEMIKNGKEFAATMNWDKIIHSYIEWYEKAIETPKNRLRIHSAIGKKIFNILGNDI